MKPHRLKYIIAGPCSVESKESIDIIAKRVAMDGATHLRGGAYKPRTNPQAFQGLGEKGLEYLALAKEKHSIPIITEIVDGRDIPLFEKYGVDIYQIGSRNMSNTRLLKDLGEKEGKTIMLKRGMCATLPEILGALQYLNPDKNKVLFCERGIRTGANADYSRNVLDLSIIPTIQKEGYEVIADPSHGGGRRELVLPLTRAAIGAGADGIMLEVHHMPEKAYSDGAQTIDFNMYIGLMREINGNQTK